MSRSELLCKNLDFCLLLSWPTAVTDFAHLTVAALRAWKLPLYRRGRCAQGQFLGWEGQDSLVSCCVLIKSWCFWDSLVLSTPRVSSPSNWKRSIYFLLLCSDPAFLTRMPKISPRFTLHGSLGLKSKFSSSKLSSDLFGHLIASINVTECNKCKRLWILVIWIH